MIDLKGAVYEHPTMGTIHIDDANEDTLREILAMEIESAKSERVELLRQRDVFAEIAS